jgi:hypothetical protein
LNYRQTPLWWKRLMTNQKPVNHLIHTVSTKTEHGLKRKGSRTRWTIKPADGSVMVSGNANANTGFIMRWPITAWWWSHLVSKKRVE